MADVANLTRELLEVGRDSLTGVYIHGSAALGDFQPGRSDLDVLVVVEDKTDDDVVDSITAVLASDRQLAAVGIEASIVNRTDAARARSPWRFRSHVTTAPADRKIVSGRDHPGDPDLALHYLVTRQAGWPAAGPSPDHVFGELDRQLVLDHLAAELRWAAIEAPTTCAVLNACRALRFADDFTICSKTDGGRWALAHHIQPDLVAAALAHRSGSGPPPTNGARAWVAVVADLLT